MTENFSNIVFLPAPVPRPPCARLKLSRKSGFDLQEVSHRLNGLPAVMVARPSRWGNRFRVGPGAEDVGTAAEAVRLFQIDLLMRMAKDPGMLEPLRRKNLACWCPLNAPCHVDVLLDLANR